MEPGVLNTLVPYDQTTSKGDLLRYQSIVGSGQHLAAQTRPDLSFTLGALARFSHNPGPIHIRASNRFLQYLKHTQYLGISYEAVQNHGNLQAYSDSDYAGDAETRKSTTGYLFKLANGPIT